jgi:hypothetical protein
VLERRLLYAAPHESLPGTDGCCDGSAAVQHHEVTPHAVSDLKYDKNKKVAPIPYHGGPVLHQGRAVHLYWGAYWNRSEGQMRSAAVDELATALGGTSYFALITQYGDSAGAPDSSGPLLAASAVEAGSEPPDGLADDALQQFVAAELGSGAVTFANENVYVIFTPPGVALKSDMGTGCDDTCAYHSSFSSDGRDIKYALIPSLDCWDICGIGKVSVSDQVTDMTTVAYSHELAEAIIDPDLNAWTKKDGEDEIGDRCDGGSQLDGAGGRWAVQDLWSNSGMLCANVYE